MGKMTAEMLESYRKRAQHQVQSYGEACAACDDLVSSAEILDFLFHIDDIERENEALRRALEQTQVDCGIEKQGYAERIAELEACLRDAPELCGPYRDLLGSDGVYYVSPAASIYGEWFKRRDALLTGQAGKPPRRNEASRSPRRPIRGGGEVIDFCPWCCNTTCLCAKPEPRCFSLVRVADESGVSGTGRVLDGVVWHNGQVTICWRTDVEGSKHGHSSLGIYPSWEAFEFIHIKSHPANQTRIEWAAKAVAEKVGGGA